WRVGTIYVLRTTFSPLCFTKETIAFLTKSRYNICNIKSIEGRFMKVKIWGARGSIPSPIRPDEIREKIITAILNITQIERGEFREELLAAILDESQSPQDASGQLVNLATAKTQVRRRQVVRAYL